MKKLEKGWYYGYITISSPSYPFRGGTKKEALVDLKKEAKRISKKLELDGMDTTISVKIGRFAFTEKDIEGGPPEITEEPPVHKSRK